MKKEDFFEAMGDMDATFVEESGKRIERPAWVKWAAVAAGLALVIGIGAYVLRDRGPHWPVLELPLTLTTSFDDLEYAPGEIAGVPHWEDMEIWEQFSSIRYEDREYGVGRVLGYLDCGVVPEERLGAELGTVTATGWDEYAAMDGEDGEHTTAVAIRAITGISPACAVAVKYDGTDGWYAGVNAYYTPETLGQLIDDLNLREELRFGYIYYNHYDRWGACHDIRLDSPAEERVWELLLSGTEVELFRGKSFRVPDMDISVDLPILGYENATLSMSKDG